jgi:hypothetical protein
MFRTFTCSRSGVSWMRVSWAEGVEHLVGGELEAIGTVALAGAHVAAADAGAQPFRTQRLPEILSQEQGGRVARHQLGALALNLRVVTSPRHR